MGEISGFCQADAAIVGGGLTGLLLGASLTHAGMRIAVLDAGNTDSSPCQDAATLMLAPVFARIEGVHGIEAARSYASALQSQLSSLLAAPPPYVQELPVYAYAFHEDLALLSSRQELLLRMQLPVSSAPDAGGCPFPVERSLVMHRQAVVDIPRWRAALQAFILRGGGQLFTDSRVIAVEDSKVCTAKGCVEAPLIILTAGKPLGLRSKRLMRLLETRRVARCMLTGHYPLHAAQQSIREGTLLLPTPGGAVVRLDADRVGVRRQQVSLAQFRRFLKSRLPDWEQEEMHYATEIFPLDGLPVVGTLPGSRCLCACGYSGCGILGAMHAASVLTRRILGQAQPEDTLYAPDRPLPASLLRRQVREMARLYAWGLLHRSAPACPHCTCRMRYSTAAQQWECPWCGSAFTMLGQVVCGPSLLPAQVSLRQRPDL